MPIVSLSEVPADSARLDCDVCIIGAGAAGSYLAARLSKTGLRVIVVEAGGRIAQKAAEIGFKTAFTAEHYAGAEAGRYFGLGGTTSHWGGALIPHASYDQVRSACPQNGSDNTASSWEHVLSVIRDRQSQVLKTLGFNKQEDFVEFPQRKFLNVWVSLAKQNICTAASLYLPFRKKNFLFLLESAMRSSDSISVFTHAVVKKWQQAPENGEPRIKNVGAVSSDGRSVVISAQHFVIAAGAVESARILLEIQADLPNTTQLSPQLGQCLGDHLSIPIAEVQVEAADYVRKTFAPRFVGSWMRAFRFVVRDREDSEPRHFAHFIFENENPGFQLAKKVLTALQSREFPRVGLKELIRGTSGIAALAWSRYVHFRLFVPKSAKILLQLDVEQPRNSENRITLSESRDDYGRRKASINWRVSESDTTWIRQIAIQFLTRWNNVGKDVPPLTALPIEGGHQKPHDAYHPVGVCRMGTDSEAVVDLNLKVKGLKNVFVASTAVFPTAGTANPTFTLLCLTEELGQNLAAKLEKTDLRCCKS